MAVDEAMLIISIVLILGGISLTGMSCQVPLLKAETTTEG